jgi:hypothetical protein
LGAQFGRNEDWPSSWPVPGCDPSSEDKIPWYLKKVQAWCGRNCWITVFRGSDVSVFDSWTEASGWVLGVKGAIWNGFLTAEQAHRAFNDALEDRLVEVLVWENNKADSK